MRDDGPIAFSATQRAAWLHKLGEQSFDLIVIGGGITGAGIFRDAARRGLRVLLVERDDFASGTSSKSSKLVHGGLRYLERFHIRLTRESCRERELLLRLNPHLVRPLPFLLPIYRSSRLHPLFIRMGLRFYEFLAGGKATPHRMLRPSEVPELAPTLKIDDLRRAALYYDSSVDDARLVIENIVDGVRAGGQALNDVEVVGFAHVQGRITRVELRARGEEHTRLAHAEQIVNAAGIDVDRVRGLSRPVDKSELHASKGVHLVVRESALPLKSTVAFMNPADGRLMFAIPWPGVVLIGTTDTFEGGDVRETSEADLDYVLAAINSVLTQSITRDDVISSFAGVRTLIVDSEEDNASSVSREHAVYEDPDGLISIAGGKLTTYRIMAKDIVDRVIEHLPENLTQALAPCRTHELPLGGAVDIEAKQSDIQKQHGLGAEQAAQLVRSYGGRVDEVLALTHTDPSLREPLIGGAPYLRCEAPYLCRYEGVLHLDDLLTRRLRVALWVPDQALDEVETIADQVAAELGWTPAQRDAEIKRYREVIASDFRPVTQANLS